MAHVCGKALSNLLTAVCHLLMVANQPSNGGSPLHSRLCSCSFSSQPSGSSPNLHVGW